MAVVPPKIEQYHFYQPADDRLPRCPLRMIVAGPSGSGKTVLLTSMITQLYRRKNGDSVWNRIFVFSPSVHVDPSWRVVGSYIEHNLKVDVAREPWAFDTWDQVALQNIVATQRRVTEISQSRGQKRMYQILVVLDDLADNPRASRNDQLLHSLFTRGRHIGCSTICSVQRYKALSPIIRVNCVSLCVYRLRSDEELQTIVDEVSGVMPKKEIIELFRRATSEPYSFLYINLAARTPDEMFWQGFDHRILAESSSGASGAPLRASS